MSRVFSLAGELKKIVQVVLGKPPPPNSIPPPNTVPPQILYPPWLNKRFAKYYTPFSSHTSKRNTNRFGIRSQHHCTVVHLKKAVIVVCLFTLETLLEAWATAAEGAAPAPSAPVTHTSAKAAHTHPQRLEYHTPPNSIPPQIVYPPGPIERQANTIPRGTVFGGGGFIGHYNPCPLHAAPGQVNAF